MSRSIPTRLPHPPFSLLPGPPATNAVGLITLLVLSIQRAAGPGHRDGLGHRYVLPFPASEVHEDSLAAAGEVASGGVWPGLGQSKGCVNQGAYTWVIGVPSLYLDVEVLLAPDSCVCVCDMCVHMALGLDTV